MQEVVIISWAVRPISIYLSFNEYLATVLLFRIPNTFSSHCKILQDGFVLCEHLIRRCLISPAPRGRYSSCQNSAATSAQNALAMPNILGRVAENGAQ